MSHFTVIVIGENIEEQLAPYEECSEDPRYREFKSTEQEDMATYLTDTLTAVILPNGEMTNEYDEKYRVFSKESFSSEYVFPEGTIKKEMKFSEFFKSFEDYKNKWCGQQERDEEFGEYGYWHNPNGHWDWYTVGGRWTGYFKPYVGGNGELGESGAFGNKPRKGWVDSAKIKDIDFDGMIDEAVEKAHADYDKLEIVLQGRAFPPTWAEVREKHGEDTEAARTEYHSNPIRKELVAAGFDLWGTEYRDYFKNSRQEFAESRASNVAVPFAVVKDGIWYQKGKMGWFGMSSGDKEQDVWNSEFWKLLKDLSPDTRLTLVDCHV